MVRAGDNLSILSAEAPINQPLMTDGSAFVQLEDEFRQAFEMTVIDLPRSMLINFPQLMADVNLVVLTCEFTLASARDAIRILSWLKTNASHVKVLIAANKVQPGVAEISKADFEASIERKIAFTIPFDAKAAANAAKLGQTFADANRTAKAGVATEINRYAEADHGFHCNDRSAYHEASAKDSWPKTIAFFDAHIKDG